MTTLRAGIGIASSRGVEWLGRALAGMPQAWLLAYLVHEAETGSFGGILPAWQVEGPSSGHSCAHFGAERSSPRRHSQTVQR